ncbi:MAG: heat-inducible transcription repressor HrcA [Gammaproteobacteria bacterium]|nr:heat-inducible transcription repressor HrcA [Gammaproteobacteria bacterium]
MGKQQNTERANHLMKVLIEKHIHDGLPVGSKALQQSSGLNLSSATIRNIMSDLERQGLLKSPHTSAGRIPTNKGYRLFVDNLLSVKPLENVLTQQIESSIASKSMQNSGKQSLIQSTSEFLSEMTGMASVVFTPRSQNLSLKHIEFVTLSSHRLLVVMVTSDDEIHNKVIETKEAFSVSQLHQMANFLNEQFSGQSINSVKQRLISEMQNARAHFDQLMSNAIDLAKDSLSQSPGAERENLIYSGTTNLMQYTEMADMEKMRQLFQAFQEKQKIINMLNHVNQAQGVQIYIGKESGYEPFSSCSVVTKSYQIDDNTVGVLGVIGPTRMSYNKIIPIVDITAKILGSTLNK